MGVSDFLSTTVTSFCSTTTFFGRPRFFGGEGVMRGVITSDMASSFVSTGEEKFASNGSRERSEEDEGEACSGV
ncbi:hypothetical protein HBI56_015110 [Parastagonospora nodorum]|nr:hypothetical protein HBI09_013960 [Parastagonospora nodorum]KAH4103665.1 hypothetical protein HBH46_110160 [Parastagonospora nodorum]KAH4213935.1 hypothetical protein HBI95_001040 [Parastagonospora nodorum]KAH4397274.1 hypothetical protein HBH97_001010 [Parastagonospora nodorum]KAH4710813.1 hypothetical protein HBH67_029300 [Parastagonospora nodorum]